VVKAIARWRTEAKENTLAAPGAITVHTQATWTMTFLKWKSYDRNHGTATATTESYMLRSTHRVTRKLMNYVLGGF
jgi:hypothetical protein